MISTAPGSSNVSCVERNLGVIVERMRFDVETRVEQEIEKSLRIADAGDGVHRLAAKDSSVRSAPSFKRQTFVTTASARNTPA